MLILINGEWTRGEFNKKAFFEGHDDCFEFDDVRTVVYDSPDENGKVIYDMINGPDEVPNTYALLDQLNPISDIVWVHEYNVCTYDNGFDFAYVIYDEIGYGQQFSRTDFGEWD